MFTQSSDNTETNLIFNNVFAHYFESELLGSVILDVFEETLENFIEYNESLLNKMKNSGWPIMYDTVEELLNELKSKNYNYYIVSSSYGLNGWILAQNLNVQNQLIE
ncbi:hypothetical protein EH150_10870 [Carnobacterium divergens]|nr:hypothetical protein [Carnobacterium divergens]